ncbi:hypothetical protein Leryth_009020 [Lithospermum erythrorhizon]|nr:hypothetical protein Leryth_009020 [Lithospermum erythrorhizon]
MVDSYTEKRVALACLTPFPYETHVGTKKQKRRVKVRWENIPAQLNYCKQNYPAAKNIDESLL